MNNNFIPVNSPLLDGNELKYIMKCIETGWISSEGSYITEFENAFAKTVDRKFGIAVSNGSAALDIAVKALNLGVNDEVIVPAFTIVSPVFSIINAGATPVLVDSDPNNWNMDVTKIEEKITKKTKAIIVVHIYGLPVEMNLILDLCKKYKLLLIEDAAEMHGQTYNGRFCGSFGDISTFSFYSNKVITSGEGGMLVCNNKNIHDSCKKLRNLSFEPNGRRFVHHAMGWNYRMTNLQAAIGLAQLEKLSEHVQKKREIGNYYSNAFKNLKEFQLPISKTEYAQNLYWVYGMVANTENLCIRMVDYLSSKMIGTRPFFWCMHEQPIFKRLGYFIDEKYPIAEKLARCGFYIPSGLGLTKKELDQVIFEIKNFKIKN